jgi:hypothetical protein
LESALSKFALLFLTVLFAGIVATFFYSATASFLLYQIVYMVNPDIRWWSGQIPGLSYSFFTVILMMIALAINYKTLSPLSPWSRQPMTKWIVLFLGSYYLMYFFALNLPLHDKFTFALTKLVIIIAIAYKLIHSERALKAVLWAYIIGATYVGYIAYSVGRNSAGRIEGIGMVDTGTDGNHTAAALVPAAVLLIYQAWMGNNKIRLLSFFCGALIVNGLVLINSRGAFLGVVAGGGLFLCYMLFSRFQRKGQRAMAFVIIIAGVSGGLYVADEVFWERMQTLQADEEGDRGGAGRMHFWWGTFDMLEDYPMGMGVGGYQRLSGLYLDESKTDYHVENRAVHSSWFQMLSEVGWLGTGIFLGLLLSAWRLLENTKKYLINQGRNEAYFQMISLQCAMLSFMITATFIDRIRAEIFFWNFLFIAAAANIYYLRHVTQPKQSRMSHGNIKKPKAAESS